MKIFCYVNPKPFDISYISLFGKPHAYHMFCDDFLSDGNEEHCPYWRCGGETHSDKCFLLNLYIEDIRNVCYGCNNKGRYKG